MRSKPLNSFLNVVPSTLSSPTSFLSAPPWHSWIQWHPPSISTSPWFLPRRALASLAWSSFPPPAWQTPTLPLGLSLALFRSPHATAHSMPHPRPGVPQSTPSAQPSGCTWRGWALSPSLCRGLSPSTPARAAQSLAPPAPSGGLGLALGSATSASPQTPIGKRDRDGAGPSTESTTTGHWGAPSRGAWGDSADPGLLRVGERHHLTGLCGWSLNHPHVSILHPKSRIPYLSLISKYQDTQTDLPFLSIFIFKYIWCIFFQLYKQKYFKWK